MCQTFIRYPIPQLGQNDSALNLPVIKKMHYRVNWDLSGRFYHYMGMYAPPIGNGAPQQWLNRWNPFNSRGGRLTYVDVDCNLWHGSFGGVVSNDTIPMTPLSSPSSVPSPCIPRHPSCGVSRYNVSYVTGPDSIDELYTKVQAHGIATLSYMNVFEFGMNVKGHASGAAVASKPDDYRNATLYGTKQNPYCYPTCICSTQGHL